MVSVFFSQSFERIVRDLGVALSDIEVDSFQFIAEHTWHRVGRQETRRTENSIGRMSPVARDLSRVSDHSIAVSEVAGVCRLSVTRVAVRTNPVPRSTALFGNDDESVIR